MSSATSARNVCTSPVDPGRSVHHSSLPISIPLPTSRDRATRSNRISPGERPIVPGLAAPADALTFAQTQDAAGRVVTLLVTAYDSDAIDAIDLTGLGARPDLDIFDAAAAVGDTRLMAAFTDGTPRYRYDVPALLAAGAAADRHIATGTNFARHATEAGSRGVFNFPKFGGPTPPRTTLVVQPDTLMDFEVEIGIRFDRDIRSTADFEAARKGVFVCGDFTDRAALARLVDPKNIESGRGFTDAKSGPDRFPTGPFLVIPRDWRAFIRNERIVTRVNGVVRQDARGGEMILDFEALVAKALRDGRRRAYVYRGTATPLLANGIIPRGTAVMSGTCGGVIFMPPMREDVVGGLIDHLALGRFLTGRPASASVANRFVRNERKAGRYLRVGDRVEHLSTSMGALMVDLVAP